jgi:hypothetical protein
MEVPPAVEGSRQLCHCCSEQKNEGKNQAATNTLPKTLGTSEPNQATPS